MVLCYDVTCIYVHTHKIVVAAVVDLRQMDDVRLIQDILR